MFHTAKDAKHGSRSGARGRGGSSQSNRNGREGRDEVLQKAKSDREERERTRAARAPAIVIQRWYRGRSVAARARATERSDWDKKTADYVTLQRTLEARGVPFIPPIKFVMASLQQLLFFMDHEQDRSRLRAFCQTILLPGLRHPDPAHDAAVYLVGLSGDNKDVKVMSSHRVRLRLLLRACLDYVNVNKSQGVPDGNAPLEALLLVTRCTGHRFDCNGVQHTSSDDVVAERRGAVAHTCLEILVKELRLFSCLRGVFLGEVAEQKAVASAGGGTSMKPPPGRQGAMNASWSLALGALDAAGDGFIPSAPAQTSFVAELLSVPLLPARLNAGNVDLLIKDRRAAFVKSMRCFRQALEGENRRDGHEGVLQDCEEGADDRGRCGTVLPSSPVSCCTTETFLVGNLSALCTKLPIEGSTSSVIAVADHLKESLLLLTFMLGMEAIPRSLLTDRQAITWQTGDSAGAAATSMTALAVPQAVQDQVRLLVSDRWMRSVSKVALNGVNEGLLQKCTEAERRETQETLEASASALAMASVRAHRAEENRSFVSKWALKLRQSSKKWFNNDLSSSASATSNGIAPNDPLISMRPSVASSPEVPSGGSGSGLIDASAASRAAALGQTGGYSGRGNQKFGTSESICERMEDRGQGMRVDSGSHSYDASRVLAFSEFIAVLLRRWGTGQHAANSVIQGLLNTMCFSTPCVAKLWAFIINEAVSFERLCEAVPVTSTKGGGLVATLATMSYMFGRSLVILDDAELYEAGQPLPLHHIRTLIKGLKLPLFTFCWNGEGSGTTAGAEQSSEEHFGKFFAAGVGRLLRGLYVRNSRRALCPSHAWIVPQTESHRVLREAKDQTPRARRLLRIMPWCMSLTQRMRIFEHLVKTDRAQRQPENTPGIPVRIRRGHVLEDGLHALGRGGRAEREMKRRLCVIYTGEAGHEESGIDMGGLFKDFWTDLSALAFDVNYGLFKVTGEGLMYPNPSSEMIHGPDHLRLFEFLGRILGKALYEGITVQPEFATFFLGFIRGDYNYLHLFHDLNGLDPELYKNLMFLKTYSGGDVEDLCLTFTVADAAFGSTTEIELVPGGSRRAVTSKNRLEYVNRVAKHHLVDSLKPQAEAFVRGLWKVINPQWLQMLSEPELQVLISGSNKTLDVEDLKRHTKYSGGFIGMDRTVRRFWTVVNSMSDKERAALLRFVTSCERPPPLGFESMHPPFCLHRVGIRTDGERLPTASTCFNTLKLPTYSSEKVMRAKLMTSIFSGTGFELS